MPWLYPPGTYLYGPPPIRPRPPTDCEKFEKWYQAKSTGPTSWMFYLPKCPCQLTKSTKCESYYADGPYVFTRDYESFDKPGPEWSTPTTPPGKAKYHPKADVCIRAAS